MRKITTVQQLLNAWYACETTIVREYSTSIREDEARLDDEVTEIAQTLGLVDPTAERREWLAKQARLDAEEDWADVLAVYKEGP
jgi:hypothetical protein